MNSIYYLNCVQDWLSQPVECSYQMRFANLVFWCLLELPMLIEPGVATWEPHAKDPWWGPLHARQLETTTSHAWSLQRIYSCLPVHCGRKLTTFWYRSTLCMFTNPILKSRWTCLTSYSVRWSHLLSFTSHCAQKLGRSLTFFEVSQLMYLVWGMVALLQRWMSGSTGNQSGFQVGCREQVGMSKHNWEKLKYLLFNFQWVVVWTVSVLVDQLPVLAQASGLEA